VRKVLVGLTLLLAVIASSARGGHRLAAGLLAVLALGALANALATPRVVASLRTPEADPTLAVPADGVAAPVRWRSPAGRGW
jgi:hypothetical protein